MQHYRHYVAHIDQDDRLMTLCGISPPPNLPNSQQGDTVELCMECYDVMRGVLAKKS